MPISCSAWLDKYFRLPAGSSQIEGRWETLPYQLAPANMMANDAIREYYEQKSARIGYTKRLVGVLFYMAEHKKRSAVVYQPTDSDSDGFVVDEVDSAIAEMPVMQGIFPDWQAKSENNKLAKKVLRGVIWDFLGAKSAGNFRRITKQLLIGDEIDGWDLEVGKQGNPIKLALTRIKGASFGKAIFGTTPTNAGESHIERLMASAHARFRFHLPCPHCEKLQYLKWGGDKDNFGIKWDPDVSDDDKPGSCYYRCEHCQEPIKYHHLEAMQLAGRWIDDISGIWTTDGEAFYLPSGNRTRAPRTVGIYINAIYSLTLTEGWPELVREWLDVKGDTLKLKTFINLVLGELWVADQDTALDGETLYRNRREHYPAQVPEDVLILVGGIDTQDDRVEFSVWGIGLGEEAWLIDHYRLMGDLSNEDTQRQAEKILHRTFTRANREKMAVAMWAWDSGGHKTDEVYNMSKRAGVKWVVPIKGANVYGKPIANFPRSKNSKKVYLTEVGTDNAKDLIYTRLNLVRSTPTEPQGGAFHFPINDDICDEEFFLQLCGERKKIEYRSGRKVMRWVELRSRVEGLDCAVYAIAALRILQQHLNVDLDELAKARSGDKKPRKSMEELGAALGAG